MTDDPTYKQLQTEASNARLRDLLLHRASVRNAASPGGEEPPATISCPLCGKEFRIAQDKIGADGICPKCGRRISFQNATPKYEEPITLEIAPNPFAPDDPEETPPLAPLLLLSAEEPSMPEEEEEFGEPVFEMDIEDSGAVWLNIDDEEDD